MTDESFKKLIIYILYRMWRLQVQIAAAHYGDSVWSPITSIGKLNKQVSEAVVDELGENFIKMEDYK